MAMPAGNLFFLDALGEFNSAILVLLIKGSSLNFS